MGPFAAISAYDIVAKGADEAREELRILPLLELWRTRLKTIAQPVRRTQLVYRWLVVSNLILVWIFEGPMMGS